LNVGTGEIFGECKPTRNGADFLAFPKRAVAPHAGQQIHVVLDNLSTHTTPDILAWLEKHRHVQFHSTPAGSSWINQIKACNNDPKPFAWTAAAEEILAKVHLVQVNIKELVDNNAK
jgi:hypothetical protein